MQTITGDGNAHDEESASCSEDVTTDHLKMAHTVTAALKSAKKKEKHHHLKEISLDQPADDWSTSSSSESSPNEDVKFPMPNGSHRDLKGVMDMGVTPALQRRRERAERQRSLIREQEEVGRRSATPLDEDGTSPLPRNFPFHSNYTPHMQISLNLHNFKANSFLF